MLVPVFSDAAGSWAMAEVVKRIRSEMANSEIRLINIELYSSKKSP
jgi:hypothetical protein